MHKTANTAVQAANRSPVRHELTHRPFGKLGETRYVSVEDSGRFNFWQAPPNIFLFATFAGPAA
jgi:hypothetical protein